MSTDLPANTTTELDGWNLVRESLDEFREAHEDSGQFLAEWVDQIDSLFREVLGEYERWEKKRRKEQDDLEERAKRIDREQQQLAQQWARIEETRCPEETVVSLAESQANLQELMQQSQHDQTAFSEAIRAIQAQMSELTDMAGSLRTTLRDGTEDDQGQLAELVSAKEQLQAEIATIREERDALRGERSLLEVELENVRRRVVELADSLDQQRRTAAEQESYWRGEFHRQCDLVERLASKWTGAMTAMSAERPAAATPVAPAAAADVAQRSRSEGNGNERDLALESVRAQFELLQKEATRRRRENADPA
ncbi:MAG: hypothetical protein JW719_11730 [Pirellulales bacterium]|nr:hypothetical protein [Pirellulales bacterium]